MKGKPIEAKNPWAKASHEPAPTVASKPPEDSPWLRSSLWIAEPSAAPVEYLEPLKQLGFTQLCVRTVHGSRALPDLSVRLSSYELAGWNVAKWGRVDQEYGTDVRCDPVAAGAITPIAAFAANVEIRWDEADNQEYVRRAGIGNGDALCTYPGGIPDGAHRYYQQAGVRVCLVQTFSETEAYGIPMQTAWEWGHFHAGYEDSIPMVGCFKGASGYADAARHAADMTPDMPRHCYLIESSGWYMTTGQGYRIDQLMAGVR